MVKPGDWINPGSVGGDSTECMIELSSRLGPGPGQLKDIEIWNYAMFYPHPYFQEIDPNQEYHVFHESFFFPWSRRARGRNSVTSWAQCGWGNGHVVASVPSRPH